MKAIRRCIEGCFYHSNAKSPEGVVFQFGTYTSEEDAIKAVEEKNQKNYNLPGDSTDWNTMFHITKLYQFKRGELVLVWKKK